MMKFQKLNLMLMIAVLSSNVSFCIEGESARRRVSDFSPQEFDSPEEMTTVREEKTDYQRRLEDTLKKAHETLGLKPDDLKGSRYDQVQDKMDLAYRIKTSKLTSADAESKFNDAYNTLDDHYTKQEEARREAIREEKTKNRPKNFDFQDGDLNSLGLLAVRMTPDELAQQLTPEMANALTSEQITSIASDPEKLKALLSNTEAVAALSPEQVKAIPSDALVKAIDGTIISKVKNIAKKIGSNGSINVLPDSFVKALDPQQAKAIIDTHDGVFKRMTNHLDDYFSKDQLSDLRKTAKIKTIFKESTETNIRQMRDAEDLVKKYAEKKYLSENDQTTLKTKMKTLSTKEKEYIANEFITNLEQNGFSRANSENGKDTPLKIKSEAFIRNYLKPNLKPNEYPALLKNQSNHYAIEIIDMDKINPTQEININKLIQDKVLTTHADSKKEASTTPGSITKTALENSYAQWFTGHIDLSKQFDNQVSEILPHQELHGQFTSAPRLEDFEDFIKYRIIKELTEKVNSAFAKDPANVNPDFMKWVKISTMTPELISKLSSDQIKALSVDQIKALSTDQIEALSTNQIKALSINQLNEFTDEQLADLAKTNQSQKDRIVTRRNLLKKSESDKQQKTEVNATKIQESQKALDEVLATPTMKASDLRKNLATMSNTDTMILSQKINADATEINRTISSLLTIKDPKKFRSFISTLPRENVQLIDNETISKMLLRSNGAIGDFAEAQLLTKFSQDQVKYLLTSRLLNDPKQIKRLKLYQLPDDIKASDVKSLGLNPDADTALRLKIATKVKLDLSTTKAVADLTAKNAPAIDPKDLSDLTSQQTEVLPTPVVKALDENQVGSLLFEDVNSDAIKALLESDNPAIQAEALAGISDDQVTEQLPEVKNAMENLPEEEWIKVSVKGKSFVQKVAQEVVTNIQEEESKPQQKRETKAQRTAREKAELDAALKKAFEEIEGKNWDKTPSKESAKQTPKAKEIKISETTQKNIDQLKRLMTDTDEYLRSGRASEKEYDKKVAAPQEYANSLSNSELKRIISITKNDSKLTHITEITKKALSQKKSK